MCTTRTSRISGRGAGTAGTRGTAAVLREEPRLRGGRCKGCACTWIGCPCYQRPLPVFLRCLHPDIVTPALTTSKGCAIGYEHLKVDSMQQQLAAALFCPWAKPCQEKMYTPSAQPLSEPFPSHSHCDTLRRTITHTCTKTDTASPAPLMPWRQLPG